MIFAALTTAWKWLTGLPRGVHYILIGAVGVLALYAWHRHEVRSAVKADREAAAQAVASTAAVASEAATGASRASQAANAERVERARQAGEDSDDPLKAILDSLRGK